MKWIWLSIAPAVTMQFSPAITSVDAPTMPKFNPDDEFAKKSK